MIYLQISKAGDAAGMLVDYGILGVFCFILLLVVAGLFKMGLNMLKQNLKGKDEVIDYERKNASDLRQRYISEVVHAFKDNEDVIKNNTSAFNELNSTLKEVKTFLHRNETILEKLWAEYKK